MSEELLERARAHARTVDIPLEYDALEWAVSERARRRAGACRWDASQGVATVILARRAYERYDWETFAGVIRHELVHAWEFQHFGESGHGERFLERARAIEAPRHCPAFADPRYLLCCVDCPWTAGRHRASRAVSDPGRYACGSCGGTYIVQHVGSGRRWRERSGFERAREELGSRW